MCRYKITIKEYNRPKPLVTYHSGKRMSKQELIDFFGLNTPDVETYKIQQIYWCVAVRDYIHIKLSECEYEYSKKPENCEFKDYGDEDISLNYFESEDSANKFIKEIEDENNCYAS